MSRERDLMAVSISRRGEDFEADTPQRLFHIGTTVYRASSDGRQFLAAVGDPSGQSPPIQVVLNWTALLERR